MALRRFGTFLCVAGLLAGLAALLAGRLAKLSIELDIFNNLIPQIAILVLACLLGLVVTRARILTVLAVILIGLIGIGLWPHFASRQHEEAMAPSAGERIIRVMTFNTSYESADWRGVADEVVHQNPDIVVLLEVGRNKRPLFEALEAVYPHHVDCLGEDYCQNVIMSKFAFQSHETRSEWTGPNMVRVTLGPELGALTVIGVHTTRPPFAVRQLEQIRALGDELAMIGGHQIVAGDFNAAPSSLMLRTLLERSGFALASGLATWPAHLGLPQIAIDHILLSPSLRIVGPARIGYPANSDHYPVIAEIAVPVP